MIQSLLVFYCSCTMYLPLIYTNTNRSRIKPVVLLVSFPYLLLLLDLCKSNSFFHPLC